MFSNWGITINEAMVSEMADAGLLKDLSVFVYLKSTHANSCIYNYTQKGLAAKSGLPLSKIRKYIPKFISRKWCTIDSHGNLLFHGFEKLYNQDKAKWIFTKLDINGTLKEIYHSLCQMALRFKQSQFEMLKALRQTIDKTSSERKARKLNKVLDRIDRTERTLPDEMSVYKISMKGIAKRLGCSVGSAHSIITSLKRRGSIKCTASKKLLVCSSDRTMLMAACADGDAYCVGNRVYQIACNSYDFNGNV